MEKNISPFGRVEQGTKTRLIEKKEEDVLFWLFQLSVLEFFVYINKKALTQLFSIWTCLLEYI